jgi:hypothetical protein
LLISSPPGMHPPRTWFCWDVLEESSLVSIPLLII